MHIREWNVSARTKSCLINAGYAYVEELKGISNAELLSIRNLNQSCIDEIKESLNSYLKDSPEVHCNEVVDVIDDMDDSDDLNYDDELYLYDDIDELEGDQGSKTNNLDYVETNERYIYIDLQDKSMPMQCEPAKGYFELLASIYDEESIITFKPALDNCEEYFKELFDSILGTLTEREQGIIRTRFGLDDGIRKTLEEVGREYQLSRERIRQILQKVLRKLKHPSRSRKLKNSLLLYEDIEISDFDAPKYGQYFESILREEILFCQTHENINCDTMIFKNIIFSPRTTPKGNVSFDHLSIDVLELSIRSYNSLKRAGITTVGQLRTMSLEELMRVRNLGRKGVEEILDVLKRKTASLGARYVYEVRDMENLCLFTENGLIPLPNEIPLTRTVLPASSLLRIMQNGFFYVSDFLNHYTQYMGMLKNQDHPVILSDESEIVQVLKYYSHPMLRVKISQKLSSDIQKNSVISFEQLEGRLRYCAEGIKGEIRKIIHDVNEAATANREFLDAVLHLEDGFK